MGTGFSYVESLDLLVKTNTEIANDLVQCVKGFFKNITIFSKTPTYILAESYGGKMGVEFANLWYKVKDILLYDFAIQLPQFPHNSH